MSLELFEQGPGVYLPILLAALVMTMALYGAFPVIFAMVRKAPITTKKYKTICYAANFLVVVLLAIINQGNVKAVPYLLWTSVFVSYGSKKLGLRGVATDAGVMKDDPSRVMECKSCRYRDRKSFNACPKCGSFAKQYVYLSEE